MSFLVPKENQDSMEVVMGIEVKTFDIDPEGFLLFVDRAFDGMVTILDELGDELANETPGLPGANSPYAILFHCIGVTNHWIGTLLGGRQVPRDRPAEFTATGAVKQISKSVGELKSQIRRDLDGFRGTQPLPDHEEERTQGWVLMHTYEELAQHHGQMELTRDIIMQNRQVSDRANHN